MMYVYRVSGSDMSLNMIPRPHPYSIIPPPLTDSLSHLFLNISCINRQIIE